MAFRHFDLDVGLLSNLFIEEVGAKKEIEHAQFNVAELVDSAANFFRGEFPIHAPSDSGGESIELPWREQYWGVGKDGRTYYPIPIAVEVEKLEKKLRNALDTGKEWLNWPDCRVAHFCVALRGSAKANLQGQAVVTMMIADEFFECVKKGRIEECWAAFSAAHDSNYECAFLAHAILLQTQAKHHEIIWNAAQKEGVIQQTSSKLFH